MDGKGNCPVCGSLELLRAGGVVRKHNELCMGKDGVHRSGFVCEGTGEPAEPAEELATAMGGG